MSPASPFRLEHEDGVATLWMDTPGSRVNVFSVPAAVELRALIASLDPARTRAIVLRSSKPRSFVNGVGLMLANVVKTKEDAARLTEPVTLTYAALRESVIPTIALIDGNCFGCGVELSLHCHHRIAVESVDTEFYMTEVSDYLFVPVFGSTADLPRLVGLRSAIDFLVWGRRWTSREALERGLVDAVLPSAPDADAVRLAVAQVLVRERMPPRDEPIDDVVADARRRIASLPHDHRAVYEDCTDLLVRSARELGTYEERRAAEREACGRSAMNPLSKAAQGFFFVREIAERLGRGAERRPPQSTTIRGVPWLTERLVPASSEGFTFEVRAEGDPTITVDYDDATVVARLEDASLVDRAGSPPDGDLPTVRVHHGALGRPFFEVVGPVDAASAIFVGLERARLRAVRTDARFVADELLDAFAAPIVRALEDGADAASVSRALREFGFTRLAALTLGDRIPGDILPLHDEDGPEAKVASAIVVAILGWAATGLDAKELPHPSIADVIAVDLLGYPVGRESPCRGAHLGGVRDLLDSDPRLTRLVPLPSLQRMRAYVDHGRPFFRG